MMNHIELSNVLNWISLNTPLSNLVMQQLKSRSYSGITMAYAGHIEPKMIPHILFFSQKGARMHVSPCVPGIAHQDSFNFLKSKGIAVYGQSVSSWEELENIWEDMLAQNPNYIFDIGGGLIQKANSKSGIVAGCEATSTGVSLLKKTQLTFPVVNWNDIPFKNLLHNRYEVGSGLWYAFRNLTGLDLCRLNVGVIGFGLVGQSVASIARGLGARVYVSDISPIKELSAASDGYQTISVNKISENVDVLVSATGAQNSINAEMLKMAKPNLIIANAGHDSREINLNGLKFIGDVIPGIGEYENNKNRLYLLSEGRLLNLAAGGGSAVNTFDFVTALITRVIDYMIHQGPKLKPGLLDLPDNFSEDLLQLKAEEIRVVKTQQT